MLLCVDTLFSCFWCGRRAFQKQNIGMSASINSWRALQQNTQKQGKTVSHNHLQWQISRISLTSAEQSAQICICCHSSFAMPLDTGQKFHLHVRPVCELLQQPPKSAKLLQQFLFQTFHHEPRILLYMRATVPS